MKPLLVAGEINVDLVFSGCAGLPAFDCEILAEEFRQGPGSSSMICAMGLARLGDAVTFAGVAGHDAWGDLCVEAMREVGIDVSPVSRDAQLSTGITVALSAAHDRALVTCPGSIAALRADDLAPTLLERHGHLHVSSYYLQSALRPGMQGLFERARAAGLSISLDPGFDPARRWTDDGIIELLDTVDVFLPNASEACAISGETSPKRALLALANGHTQIVVKCGSAGCITLDEQNTPLLIPAFAISARDTTGAGDAFDAGFLYAWRRGMALVDCLRWASACGALSTRGIGGTASQADTAEVTDLLARQP